MSTYINMNSYLKSVFHQIVSYERIYLFGHMGIFRHMCRRFCHRKMCYFLQPLSIMQRHSWRGAMSPSCPISWEKLTLNCFLSATSNLWVPGVVKGAIFPPAQDLKINAVSQQVVTDVLPCVGVLSKLIHQWWFLKGRSSQLAQRN